MVQRSQPQGQGVYAEGGRLSWLKTIFMVALIRLRKWQGNGFVRLTCFRTTPLKQNEMEKIITFSQIKYNWWKEPYCCGEVFILYSH